MLSEGVNEYHQLFNFSLWDSIDRDNLSSSSSNPGNILVLILAFCLLAIVLVCFGFFIWFFITSSEHSQVRLLNILNVYLSVGCIGGSIIIFVIMLASGLGYSDTNIQGDDQLVT